MKKSNIENIYDLSPLQRGFLFQTLFAPHSGVYFEQLSCILRGDLEITCFERAWQQVINRHSILRTAFFWEDVEKPLQIVHREVNLSCTHHDWRVLQKSVQEERIAIFLEKDRQQGFFLNKPPLMRLALLRLGEYRYQFIWSYHHALLDGWSVSLLLGEIFQLYHAFKTGKTLQLPPSAIGRKKVGKLPI